MNTGHYGRVLAIACLATWTLLSAATARGQGIALTGVGPVNRAMGGASAAAPLDAAGALHWNPATISGLPSPELLVGLEMLVPVEELSSTFPAAGSGATSGEPGASPIPTMAWVHKAEGSPWTMGLGIYGIAGFRTNYPASTTNPILSPQQSLGGVGLGRLFSEAEFFQLAPTVSYAVTDRLSIGVAPTVTVARIALDPLVVAPPAGAPPIYTSGRGTRYHWGGGVQVGLYYIADNGWHLGASVKSPQWMEDFRFFTEDGAGGTRVEKVDLDYPLIVSLGAAYCGWENLIVALDVRYFNYETADGFGTPAGFDANLAITGLDWSSIVSVATGVQYQVNDCLYLRLGYTYQENPIQSEETFFNVASPLIVEHILAAGLSYDLACNVSLSAVYLYGVENSQSGRFYAPGIGAIDGSSVTNEISAHGLAMGVTVRY